MSVVISRGQHDTAEQGMNLLEYVSVLAGQSFSEHPEGVSEVIGAMLRAFNEDCREGLRQSLVEFAKPLIKSHKSKKMEEKRAWIVLDWFVRAHTYVWLQACAVDDDLLAVVQAWPEVNLASAPVMVEKIEDLRRAVWADMLKVKPDIEDERIGDRALDIECYTGVYAALEYRVNAAVEGTGNAGLYSQVMAAAATLIHCLTLWAAWQETANACSLEPTVQVLEQSFIKLIRRLLTA